MKWDDSKFIGFDMETSGSIPEYALQPYRVKYGSAWITCYAEAGTMLPDKVTGKLYPKVADLRNFLRRCIDQNLTVCGWNITFDVAWLIAYGLEPEVMQVKWLDGMLLYRHWDIEPEYDTVRHKKKSYGLKPTVAEQWPHLAGYEDDVDFHDPSEEARAKLFEYCKRDTKYALALTKKYYNLLAQDPQRLAAALIEAKSIPLVASANVRGMVADTDYVSGLSADLDKVAAKCLEMLAPHGVTEKVVRSPKQLSNLLFNEWGLPVIKQNVSDKTGSTTDSTDKEVLHELAFIDPRAKTLREYREALNNKTKFPVAILKSVEYNGDGMTHPSARIFGTYTSRMTYESKQGKNKDERQIGFALHQMKRGKKFRNQIKAPEGYTLVEYDAAGQEFRWMAMASGDETMLALCQPGEDPHSYMGAQIADQDYRALIRAVKEGDEHADLTRKLGKFSNLSFQYRVGAKKATSKARVEYLLDVVEEQVRGFISTYKQTYVGVPEYWDRQIAECSRLGYAETFAGRRVQLRGDFNGKFGWNLASTAINYRIQGTGGDQKYLAIAVLKPYMVREGVLFAWELHDGLYLYVPTDKLAKCVPEMNAMLNNLPYKRAWGFTPSIPLPWDCKAGPSWGELKEWTPQ